MHTWLHVFSLNAQGASLPFIKPRQDASLDRVATTGLSQSTATYGPCQSSLSPATLGGVARIVIETVNVKLMTRMKGCKE
jgi:hypothetical protein